MINVLMLDIETTGLNPKTDYILEIAAIPVQITKNQGINDGHEHVNVLIDVDLSNVFGISPVVYKMHKESGLLDDLKNKQTFKLTQAENMLITLINESFGREAKNIQLGGNSVHFDLNFIKEHMPTLAKRLSYRVMDMTPYRTVRNTLLGITENVPKHRAMDDIMYSLSLLHEFGDVIQRGYSEVPKSN